MEVEIKPPPNLSYVAPHSCRSSIQGERQPETISESVVCSPRQDRAKPARKDHGNFHTGQRQLLPRLLAVKSPDGRTPLQESLFTLRALALQRPCTAVSHRGSLLSQTSCPAASEDRSALALTPHAVLSAGEGVPRRTQSASQTPALPKYRSCVWHEGRCSAHKIHL